MTGQGHFDSHRDAGAFVAAALVNALAVESTEPGAVRSVLQPILAVDPPSLVRLTERDGPAFVALAAELERVFAAVDEGDVDAAAGVLNALLARHPAHPHLAREPDGRWRLHHHPADAALVPMWTAICAESLARVIDAGDSERLGTCARPGCARVFLDGSKNASRRFCSTACQNRVKAAAFRRRRAATP